MNLKQHIQATKVIEKLTNKESENDIFHLIAKWRYYSVGKTLKSLDLTLNNLNLFDCNTLISYTRLCIELASHLPKDTDIKKTSSNIPTFVISGLRHCHVLILTSSKNIFPTQLRLQDQTSKEGEYTSAGPH
jgi:hypothetical protein